MTELQYFDSRVLVKAYLREPETDRALDALEAWCRQGPPKARVDALEITRGPVNGYQDFDVRR